MGVAKVHVDHQTTKFNSLPKFLAIQYDQYTTTFGTAAWNRKSVIGKAVELVAERVMAVTTGLLGLRSNENTNFRPFFSNAVMLGIPPTCIILCTCKQINTLYSIHATHVIL